MSVLTRLGASLPTLSEEATVRASPSTSGQSPDLGLWVNKGQRAGGR